MNRRVVITGMGAICALGHDARTVWVGMREGKSAIAPLTGFENQDMRVKVAAQVRDFDPAAHFDSKKLILLDRVSQFTLVAAREAVRQSGLDFAQGNLSQRSACVVGTASMLTSSSTTLTRSGTRLRRAAAWSSDTCRGLGS